MIQKFKKKPATIQAVQYTDKESITEIEALIQANCRFSLSEKELVVPGSYGNTMARKNDYVVKDDGMIYVCSPSTFAEIFEPA